jgi:uncharacterized protein (TIGR02594 family)
MTVLAIQRALKARGFDPGPLDDVWGRKTIAAVKALQKAHGLEVDGVVGPWTLAALSKELPASAASLPRVEPVWLAEARRHMGLREVKGAGTNQTIARWLDRLKAAWRDDETPWCSTFVAWCIAATLPDEPLPTNPFGARNWLKWGNGLLEPAPGAVAVFWRGSRAGYQGHVGFYVGERRSDGAIRVLGGNQSDAVNETWIAKDRLLGFRWPLAVEAPAPRRVFLTAAGALSRNEA